ncbi:MAG TPA: GNAT family N-acetyltransferase [Methylomirabilota bacterium]|nr:GNAT family N-acetyltransferase [Methylomirabilota bacterium]
MSELRLRLATAADAEAICRIYNQGIEDRLATLETELRTAEERRKWLTSRGPRHPVVVVEIIVAGVVCPARTEGGLFQAVPGSAEHAAPATIGWGSLNVFNPREAYRFVADFSVYVERSWRGKGVGSLLLERLIELARQHGYHKMVLSAFPTNTSGIALYEKFGFRTVGIYHEQGLLDGAWVDTIAMEKLL